MRIIEPVTITDSMLVATNLVEELPYGTGAGASYNKWTASTTYSTSTQVCWIWTYEYDPMDGHSMRDYVGTEYFGLFTAAYSSNLNRQPGKVKPTFGAGETLPQSNYWTRNSYAAAWNAATTYNTGAIVGRISGSTGAFYQSLQDGNVNQDPVTATAYWSALPANAWPGGSGGAVYNEWSGATTYASGAQVIVTGGGVSALYTSLQNSNLNKTPASEPTWWRYEGDSYKSWASGTAYVTGDTVIDLRTHHAYEALQSTTGDDPTTDAGTNWLDLGPTNRWAMFDTANSSQSSRSDEIDVTFTPGQACDSLALMNLTAASVQIVVTSVVGGGTVYDQTFDLSDNGFITDWRHYFFDPVSYQADLIVNDLPQYADAVVQVIISHPGAVAECGALVIGASTTLGGTIYGASTGIIDFSRKVADDFGNYTLVERTYAKRARFKVFCLNTQIDSISAQLARVRATPVIYQGTDDYAMTWIYGFFRDFSVDIEYPRHSYLNLEAEGLS